MSGAEEIEFDIERTRDEMAGTLQAIERKLSPNRLMDEAMETMNATLTQSRFADLVRENPLPLALVGLGAGWLVLSSLRGGTNGRGQDITDYGEPGFPGSVAGAMEEAGEWAGYGAGSAGDLARQVGDAAENVGDQAKRSAQDLAAAARARAMGLSRKVDSATRNLRNQAGDLFEEHPLTIGLFAVVAGLAIGAALPRSRREAAIIGVTGADLLGQARQAGRDALQKVGKVVQRAAEATSQEAQTPPTTH